MQGGDPDGGQCSRQSGCGSGAWGDDRSTGGELVALVGRFKKERKKRQVRVKAAFSTTFSIFGGKKTMWRMKTKSKRAQRHRKKIRRVRC